MKPLQVLPLILGFLCFSTAGMVNAQSTNENTGTPLTRAQVKLERDEFLKTHHYDEATSNWVLNSGSEPPAGMKTRAEVKAERDEFLRNNHYDAAKETWVPLKANPRKLETLSRAQVRSETRQFLRTHRWDDSSGTWVEQPPAKKKK